MATVDMHRKFGEVWHVVFKICKKTYNQTNTLGWKCAVSFRTVFYIAYKPMHDVWFVCLGLFGTELLSDQ